MTFFLWKPYTYCLIASKPAEHFTDLGQIRRQTVDPTVYAHMPNYIRIRLLCHLSGTKKRNVGQILIFRADIPSPFLPIRAKIWCARADPQSTLSKFRLDRFIPSPSGGEKPKVLPFLDFGILWRRQLVAVWECWTRVHNYKPSPIQRYRNRFCTPASSWRNRKQNLCRSKAQRTDRHTKQQTKLETVSIAEPLQNRQHAQNP